MAKSDIEYHEVKPVAAMDVALRRTAPLIEKCLRVQVAGQDRITTLAVSCYLQGVEDGHTAARNHMNDGQTVRVPQNSDEALEHRFKHHPPKTPEQGQQYADVRSAILECAKKCRDLTPASPEQTRAFNAMDEAMFLFNAAIARHA